ncbi:MAG: metallophosphoesterase [Caldilineaceae bacterium]|nr:metallophosphoesterase [Caldilineaceae bacterium]
MAVNGNQKQWPMLLQNRALQMQVLGGVGLLTGLGAGLASYAVLQEPFRICLERLTIRLPNAKGRLPSNGLRILHLSDSHFQGIHWREQAKIERIRQLTKGLEYDLLIHTGDFWHNEIGLENILTLLDNIPAPRLGGYGVLGNHDYVCYSHSDMLTRNWDRYQTYAGQNGVHENGNGHKTRTLTGSVTGTVARAREFYRFAQYVLNMPFELKRVHFNDVNRLCTALANHGIQVLHNESLRLRHNVGQSDGVDLYLAGVDDVTEGTPDLNGALHDLAPDEPNILLSHNPDILEETDSRRANLVLAGHTHGGQVVLPLLGAAHTHSEHLGRREAAGYMLRDQTQVYVSRGIGEGIPLRFRAQPQIALITVVAA